MGPSNWDIQGASKRAARAVGDTELDDDEMRAVIKDMREDLEKVLESLRRYTKDENLTRATMMLGFMEWKYLTYREGFESIRNCDSLGSFGDDKDWSK